MCPCCTPSTNQTTLKQTLMISKGWEVSSSIPTPISFAFFAYSDRWMKSMSGDSTTRPEFGRLLHYRLLRQGKLSDASRAMLRFQGMVDDAEADPELVNDAPEDLALGDVVEFECYDPFSESINVEDKHWVKYPEGSTNEYLWNLVREHDAKEFGVGESGSANAGSASGSAPAEPGSTVSSGTPAASSDGATADGFLVIHKEDASMEQASEDSAMCDPTVPMETAEHVLESADYDADDAIL